MTARDPMDRRRRAAQAACDRSLGKLYKPATLDCGKLTGLHLRKLGYKLELPKVGAYSTPAGALRWLKKRGFDSLEARLDGLGLPRIAPAEMLVGDIVALESVDALAALFIWVGQGLALGFSEGCDQCALVRPSAFKTAWSVLP